MLTVVLAALALTPASALAATGDLAQLPGQAGCVKMEGLFGPGEPDPLCADGVALDNTADVATSPDGKNVYVISQSPGSVAIFDRNPTTGALTQKTGTAACVSDTGAGGQVGTFPCQDGKALGVASSATVSPDGKNVYVTSYAGVAIFNRAADGALTQKTGLAGCISDTGQSDPFDPDTTAGQCATAAGFSSLSFKSQRSIAVSPDGRTTYVASQGADAVAVFDRNVETGTLTQKDGQAGCVSDTGQSHPDDPATAGRCQDGKALDGVFALTVSPDGKNLYAISDPADAVAIFDRGATGALTQKSGPAGCVSETGTSGACADGKALVLTNVTYEGEFGPPLPRAVTISPDGKNVYVAAHGSDAVAIFDRGTAGALMQKADPAGCVAENPTGGACADGNALDRVSGVAVSPDGQSLYAVSYEHTSNTVESAAGRNGSAIVIFDRDVATGALAQKVGKAGCIQDDNYFTAENPAACNRAHLIAGAASVAVSPNGRNVYVASRNGRSVTTFGRELPPDADNDGVFDATDRCPNQAGPASNKGCPVSGPTPPGGGNPPGGGGPPANTSNVINGTPGNDTLTGTAGADVINCGAGNDVVNAGGGDDVINCGAGDDRVSGNAGDDRINGDSGNDRLSGNEGDDRVVGGSGNDRANGNEGNDRVGGQSGNDRVGGQSGSDRVNGESGRDRVSGGSGNDRASGSSGNDRVNGDSGRDRVSGGSANDVVSGSAGNDRLAGDSGRDRLSGGSGADALNSRDRSRDRVSCGSRRDRVSADRRDRISRDCERVRRRR